MDGSLGHLRLFAPAADQPAPPPAVRADPRELANRELIRPPTYRRGHAGLEPFSAAWLDRLAAKRYQRHGAWLAAVIKKVDHPRCGTLPDFGNFKVSDSEMYDRYKGIEELMPFAKAVSAKSHRALVPSGSQFLWHRY